MAMSVEETTWDLHTISGYGGLALMVILAVAGAWAIRTDNRDVLTSFHKFAVPIGLFWLVSFMVSFNRSEPGLVHGSALTAFRRSVHCRRRS